MTDLYFIVFQAAQVLSLLILLVVFVLIWRYRRANGAHAMIALILVVFIWTLFYLLGTNSLTMEKHVLIFKIGFFALMIVPIAWLLFSVNYTAGRRVITG